MKEQKIIKRDWRAFREAGTRLSLSGLVGLFMLSCYFDVIIPEEVSDTATISFAEDIQPLFDATCVSCHNGNIASPDLTSGNAYLELTAGGYYSVAEPEQSVLVQKLSADHPFEGALTAAELQKIINWMSQGAQDN